MSKYTGYDEKSKARTMRYMKEHRDRITIGVLKGDKDKYKAYAQSRGMSLNALVVYLLDKDIEENKA